MKRRIIAWIALVIFIAIVINILFIHIYVTESVIIFMLYFLFFFFVYNKNSFLYYSRKPHVPESDENYGGTNAETGAASDDAEEKNIPEE